MQIRFSPWAFISLAAVSLFGCTNEAPQTNVEAVSATGNHPPVVRSARIMPESPVLTAPLTVQVDAEDPDRTAVSFKVKWFVNDTLMPGDNLSALAPDRLRRGDRVSAEVTPFDGVIEGTTYKTQMITIGNTAPVISTVLLEPAEAMPGDRIRARVDAADADHDMIHFNFRWWKNKNLIHEGDASEISTEGFGRKDVIRVEVTPYDQSRGGETVSSGLLVLGNSPPQFISSPHMPSDGDRFLYSVQARDVDGDPINYLLETAPPGMIINEKTGQISWQMPSGQFGTFHVRVIARDGQGGEAHQEFDLTLSAPSSVKPAGV